MLAVHELLWGPSLSSDKVGVFSLLICSCEALWGGHFEGAFVY